jgi:MFS transporter, SP family, arabinose:H+ symporter
VRSEPRNDADRKYSHLNGDYNNSNSLFAGGQQTFRKLLRKAGYATAIVGKWHLSPDPTGFDYWHMTNSISNSAAESKAQSKRNFYIAATVSTAAIAGFLFGYDGAIMGAALPYMTDLFHLTPAMRGFVATNAVIGCLFGPFVGGWLCDKIGCEKTLIVCASLLGLGALMTAIAFSVTLPGGLTVSALAMFNIFRILCGFAIGIGSIAAPLYIAEVAPPQMRGKLGVTFQLAIVIGSAAAPLVAYPLSLYLPADTSWRWMFGSQLVVVALLFVFLFALAPSPRWLAEKGRFKEALDVLKKIHEPALAERELVEIQTAVNEEQGGWGELLLPNVRYALLIGCLLAFFNNWTGWSAMGNYITVLVQLSGVTSHSTAILQFAFTYVSMAIVTAISLFLVDRVGRRPLWIVASILMALVTFVSGLVFHFPLHGWVVLLVLCLCTVPHGLALGGLPWLMMSELYPNRVRAKAVALTTSFLWLVIYSCGQLFPIFLQASTDQFGSAAGVFWLFTVICIFSTIFGCTIMPETKGRTLEEIARSWTKK